MHQTEHSEFQQKMEAELRQTVQVIMDEHQYESQIVNQYRNYIKKGQVRTPDSILNNHLFIQ